MKKQTDQSPKKERPISPEKRVAMAANEAYGIKVETAFERKYGHLPTLKLHSIAFELEMTSHNLRYMAWKRREKEHQGN